MRPRFADAGLVIWAAAVLAILAAPTAVRADLPPRRPLPDYDGRGTPPPSPSEVLSWVPRVLLFPAYVITEYGIRTPIAWALTNLERRGAIDWVLKSRQHRGELHIVPTAVVDLGSITSVGLSLTWRRAFVTGNELRLRIATGGTNTWRLLLHDRYMVTPTALFGLKAEYLERADWRFHGLGPDTREGDEQRFHWARADATAFTQWDVNPHGRLELSTGLRHDRFGDPRWIPQFPLPGFENKGTLFARASTFIDSRPADTPNVTGARFEGRIEYDIDLSRPRSRRWIAYEIEGSVFIEVMHPGRVLGFRAFAAFTDPLSQEPVPLVDLVTLGGFETMRGWFVGRFRGESAAVFTLSYRYPVWYLLDGTVYFEAGNVFGRHLEGFDPRLLFGSAGVGFRSTGHRDVSFDVLLAVGTSRFDEPFALRNVRLALGINRGF